MAINGCTRNAIYIKILKLPFSSTFDLVKVGLTGLEFINGVDYKIKRRVQHPNYTVERASGENDYDTSQLYFTRNAIVLDETETIKMVPGKK